ncbi:MAG: COX15/CtaA family protein [Thermoplasmata archaeon]|nr:COX15/CtaA family protein [Thermoplasmata archaeon]
MDGHRLFRVWTIVAFGATYVTLLLGGNVMASDSGLACPAWPSCNGSYLVGFSGHVGIEWAHRVAALVLSFVVLGLVLVALVYEARRPALRDLSIAALAVVFAQALLGGLVIATSLATAVVLAHFALATVLFGLTLVLVVLANLREIPKRWMEWAWRATEPLDLDADGGEGAERTPAPALTPLHPEP